MKNEAAIVIVCGVPDFIISSGYLRRERHSQPHTQIKVYFRQRGGGAVSIGREGQRGGGGVVSTGSGRGSHQHQQLSSPNAQVGTVTISVHFQVFIRWKLSHLFWDFVSPVFSLGKILNTMAVDRGQTTKPTNTRPTCFFFFSSHTLYRFF